MRFGVDVSTHNGAINWERAKNAGVEFAMIRAGYGRNTIDGRFFYNISECNRLEIPCGVYWFSYASDVAGAIAEAEYCLSCVKPYKLEYPIAYDFEYDSVRYAKARGTTITKALASAMADAFLSTIEKGGYYAINYANPDYLTNYFNSDVTNKFALWLAAWNNNANPPRDCAIWQYGISDNVAGFSGAVDANRCYIDFPKIIREAGLNHLEPIEPIVETPVVETPIVETPIVEVKEPTKEIEPWFVEGLKWGVETGLTDGSAPDEPISLKRMITILHRYNKLYEDK